MITIKTKEQVAAEEAAAEKARTTEAKLMELCIEDGIETEADAQAKHPAEIAAAKEAAKAIGKAFSFEQALACWKARKQHEAEMKENADKENA